uniref:Uncharacterized protein n=1 Tax=Oryza barthii TaxID=65489 RepID=A0A0D3H9X9_9ORYZ
MELLSEVRSAGKLTASIFLKPFCFCFEGQRQQLEETPDTDNSNRYSEVTGKPELDLVLVITSSLKLNNLFPTVSFFIVE